MKEKMTKEDLLTELQSSELDSNIQYIQPDYELNLTSNDPSFDNQWGLHNNNQVAIAQSVSTEDMMR